MRALIGFLFAVFACDSAQAGMPSECATIKNDIERLQCYDGYFRPKAEDKDRPETRKTPTSPWQFSTKTDKMTDKVSYYLINRAIEQESEYPDRRFLLVITCDRQTASAYFFTDQYLSGQNTERRRVRFRVDGAITVTVYLILILVRPITVTVYLILILVRVRRLSAPLCRLQTAAGGAFQGIQPIITTNGPTGRFRLP